MPVFQQFFTDAKYLILQNVSC